MSVELATRQPSFSAPMSWSSGTNTSAKNTSLNSDSSVIWRSGRTSTPGGAHVDDEVRDALLLRHVGVGAGEAHAPVGELRVARPHLLAVEQPAAVGARRRASTTAARSLPAPGSLNSWHHSSLGREDVGQPACLLLGRAVREQRGADEVDADAADELGRPGPRELLGDDEVLDRPRRRARRTPRARRRRPSGPRRACACHSRPNATSSARSSKRGGRPLPYSHGRCSRSQARHLVAQRGFGVRRRRGPFGAGAYRRAVRATVSRRVSATAGSESPRSVSSRRRPGRREPDASAAFLADSHDAGLDHVCCGDHVSFFVGRGVRRPAPGDRAGAAPPHACPCTTGVYLLPLRHPVLVARQLADSRQLAPGAARLRRRIGGEDPPRGRDLRRRSRRPGAGAWTSA